MKRLIVKTGIFLLGFSIIYSLLAHTLARPVDGQWDCSGLKYVYENKNCYDAIFCGTSMVVVNVSNQELYEKFGISAVTLGTPVQGVYLSYYTLEEALKYQKPKFVIFDTKAMFYPEGQLQADMERLEYFYLHYPLDYMKNNLTKYNAVKQAKELLPSINYMDYFLDLYYDHDNWQSLTINNFERKSGSHVINGNYCSFNIYEGLSSIKSNRTELTPNSGEIQILPDINLSYFKRIYELCEEKGVQLVLLWGAGFQQWNWRYHNTINSLAEEYNVPFLDFNTAEQEMDFEWAFDMSDDVYHMNISGTTKWTDYIGNYLFDNYNFDAEKNSAKKKKIFSANSEKYAHMTNAMQDKINLLKATDFESYLTRLSELKDDENIVFLVSSDQTLKNLSVKSLKKLQHLGIIHDFLHSDEINYAAAIYKSKVSDVLSADDINYYDGIDSGWTYCLKNGNSNTGTAASIVVNGNEYAQGGSGLNIVVFNKVCNEIISSVYFDLTTSKNPASSRIVEKSLQINQYEAEPNVWLDY